MTDPNAKITVVAQAYTPALLGAVGQVMVANLWHEQRPPSARWSVKSVPRGTWRSEPPLWRFGETE
jgi:hypothetical protein